MLLILTYLCFRYIEYHDVNKQILLRNWVFGEVLYIIFRGLYQRFARYFEVLLRVVSIPLAKLSEPNLIFRIPRRRERHYVPDSEFINRKGHPALKKLETKSETMTERIC